jgi:hypothetical protein
LLLLIINIKFLAQSVGSSSFGSFGFLVFNDGLFDEFGVLANFFVEPVQHFLKVIELFEFFPGIF